MAKHRGGKFYEFLCLLGRVPVRIDEIAEDLQQEKSKVHGHIRQAEAAGMVFVRTRANGGLYSIEITAETWDRLQAAISVVQPRKACK